MISSYHDVASARDEDIPIRTNRSSHLLASGALLRSTSWITGGYRYQMERYLRIERCEFHFTVTLVCLITCGSPIAKVDLLRPAFLSPEPHVRLESILTLTTCLVVCRVSLRAHASPRASRTQYMWTNPCITKGKKSSIVREQCLPEKNCKCMIIVYRARSERYWDEM